MAGELSRRLGEHRGGSVRQPWRPAGKLRMHTELTLPPGSWLPPEWVHPAPSRSLKQQWAYVPEPSALHGLSAETPEHYLEGWARAPRQRARPPSIRAIRMRPKAVGSEKGTGGVPGGANYLSRCSAQEGAELKNAVSAADGLDSPGSSRKAHFNELPG